MTALAKSIKYSLKTTLRIFQGLKQRSRKLSLRAPKRAPRWDGQPVLDNGAILVGHCSVIQPAGPLAR